MKISAVKFVSKDNQKMYRVTAISEIFAKKGLPDNYLKQRPSIYCDNLWSHCYLHWTENGEIRIDTGSVFSEEMFRRIILEINEAGKALKTINDERRKTEKTWQGEVTYII